MMRVSVLVSTFNRPRALARVLDALASQTVAPLEVVVADDGSQPETAALVEQVKQHFPVPLIHAWQEDHGFRLSAVRNLAVSRSSGDWLHFLDGDCVAQTSLVERVCELAEPGWMLAGDRMLLSEQFTAQVEADALPIHRWSRGQWKSCRQQGGVNRLHPLNFWPYKLGRAWRQRDWKSFRSANVGLMREDFVRVNGFEAEMEGWGLEDSEFAVRAINAGLRIRSGRWALGVFHLWHREQSREAVEKNKQIFQYAISSGKTRANIGLAEVGH
ncbi:MAG: glycosyltransferase [Burkholderiaceae bacterium]